MKTTKWICATSCAALLAMSACDNQLLEKTNTTESPKIEVQPQSANATLGYDETLNELAMSLSYAIEDSPELRMELVNAFEGIGKRYLQLVDLVGLESLTPLGTIWQKQTNVFLHEICSIYPNIYLGITKDIAGYQNLIQSTRNGSGSATAGGNISPYAVIYKPLGTPEGETFIGYENGGYNCEVSNVETDDRLLFVLEGSCYTDEEMEDELKFIGQGISPAESGFFGITLSVRLDTPKSGCKSGFGLCKPEIKRHDGGSVVIEPDLIYIPYEEHIEYIELALAENTTNINPEYAILPIDADTYIEDLEHQETIAYIEPKLYSFDPSIGDYGGFRVELTPYTEQ